jgi:hypothetical protein
MDGDWFGGQSDSEQAGTPLSSDGSAASWVVDDGDSDGQHPWELPPAGQDDGADSVDAGHLFAGAAAADGGVHGGDDAGDDGGGAAAAAAPPAVVSSRAPLSAPPVVKRQRVAATASPAAETAARPRARASAAEQAAATAAGTGDNTLSFADAWSLLSDPANPCDGPRPNRLLTDDDRPTERGRLYKELHHAEVGGHVRRRGSDKWERKQGKKGHSDGTIAESGTVLRRSYGTISIMDTDGDVAGKATYHQYEVLSPGGARAVKSEHSKYRLFHLLPQRTRENNVQKDLMRVQTKGPDQPGLRWIQFENEAGEFRGAIEQNQQGFATFNTGAGDFAEWHRRMPDEAPFEEGDVVGFAPPPAGSEDAQHCLTRRTKGMASLGIISRRAAVAGSMPRREDVHLYDTVAYTGRVPVKIRGRASVKAGQALGPSGYEDGTATVVHRCSFVRATVGVAETTVKQQGKEGKGEGMELTEHCAAPAGQEWQHVPCTVVAPSQTVQGRWKLQAVFLLTCAVVLACALSTYWQYETTDCEPIQLEFGVLQGDCSGASGSECVLSCASDYALVPVNEPHRTDTPATGQPSPVTRKCIGMSRRYDGQEWQCERRYCPSEHVDMLTADEPELKCDGCDASRSTQLSIQRSPVSAQPVLTPCPDHDSYVVGSVNRTCTPQGWGEWRGVCHRKMCPNATLRLSPPMVALKLPWPDSEYVSHKEASNWASIHAAPESTTLNVACPANYFIGGGLTLRCPDGAQQWVLADETAGQCTDIRCSAKMSWPALPDGTAAYNMTMPSAIKRDGIIHVPCCEGAPTSTGSCEDGTGRMGYRIPVRCVGDGVWEIAETGNHRSAVVGSCNMLTRCCESSRLIGYDSTRPAKAAELWQQFQSLAPARWLPQRGALMEVKLSVAGGDSTAMFAAPPVATPHRSYVLDSNLPEDFSSFGADGTGLPEEVSNGRAAAAFARVACRQFGFRSAPLVTTCGSLLKAQLAAATRGDSRDAQTLGNITLQLCSHVGKDGLTPSVPYTFSSHDLCDVSGPSPVGAVQCSAIVHPTQGIIRRFFFLTETIQERLFR